MTNFAQMFYQAGFSVVPVKPRSKEPLVKWQHYQSERAPAEEFQRWNFDRLNLGIVTGYNGLTVVDFDDFGQYLHWQKWAAESPLFPVLRRAFSVRSRRGVHVYFRLLQPVKSRHIQQMDVKGQYGLIIGPGSVHESGVIYQALNDFYIPTFQALSDVLPASLLVQDAPPDTPAPRHWPRPAHDFQPGHRLVERIKAAYRIQDFIKTPLKETGGSFVMTNCPFHDDEHPSFWLNTERQICNCFTCAFPKPLDVIGFYAMLYGLSNREAIFTLANMLEVRQC